MAVNNRASFTCDVCGTVAEVESPQGSPLPTRWFQAFYQSDVMLMKDYASMPSGYVCSQACLVEWSNTIQDRVTANMEALRSGVSK